MKGIIKRNNLLTCDLLGAAVEEFSEKSEEADWWRWRWSFIHVANKFRSAELPLCVRLSLNTLIGVRHHGNEQVDEHDDRDHHINPENHLHDGFGKSGTQVHRWHEVWLHQSEQSEEQHLESVDWWLEYYQREIVGSLRLEYWLVNGA